MSLNEELPIKRFILKDATASFMQNLIRIIGPKNENSLIIQNYKMKENITTSAKTFDELTLPEANIGNLLNEVILKLQSGSDNTYKIYELYGDLYDSFCAELKNKWSLENIPFDSTELPILKEYIKNIKKQLSLTNI